MKTLWEKLNEATQPGHSATKEAIDEIALGLGYNGKEPILYVMKRAQRLAQMKGRSIKNEADFLHYFNLAKGNLAAQFGVAR